MFVEDVGSGFPLIVLHGGPGLDHTMFRPWLDPLGDEFRLLYADEREQTVETEPELKELLAAQMPFHFHGEPPPGYGEETVGSPEVLRHFARIGYGDFDYRPQLANVRRPTLVIVGEHDRTTTTRGARVLHEGIEGSELVVVPNAGHMSFVESPERYLDAARSFLRAASAA